MPEKDKLVRGMVPGEIQKRDVKNMRILLL